MFVDEQPLDGPKAIPTMHAGVVFRSRLEATWALFLDHLEEPWQFEAEAFELPSGKYLPDLLLPRLDIWLEIKPKAPSEREKRLCLELCNATEQKVVLAFGPFGVWMDPKRAVHYQPTALAYVPMPGPDGLHCVGPDERFWPCLCPVCEKFGLEFEGRGARICGETCCPSDDEGYTFDDKRIQVAALMAGAERWWG